MAPPNRRWDAVLFDLDGTLADTIPLILASYRHTMTVHRGGVMEDALWLRHVGRPLRETLKDFTRDPAEAKAMLETYVGYQRRAHDEMVVPFPGAREVVTALVEAGVPVALVTSKAREMALRTLAVCGLEDAFPVAITADEVRRGKPHPEPVRTALERLALRPSDRTLFVGDSPHDVAAGRAAGVRTVGVTWGGAFGREALTASEPHHIIESFPELLEL